jgi:MOSC domain-containing protein YiiM
MKIVSLNVGLPSAQLYQGQQVITGGAKQSVSRAVLRFENFDGDRQADLLNHGGLEKAVCVYPFDHYPYWSRRLGRDLKPGAFSENLTVCGAIETEVCVGDVFRIGEAVVMQVSQPRMPCAKLAGKNGSKGLPKLMADVGYTGFYMRVLSEGVVAAGDRFDLERAHPDGITIAEVNGIIYEKSYDVALIGRLAELAEFSKVGRALFARRLERLVSRG